MPGIDPECKLGVLDVGVVGTGLLPDKLSGL